MKKLLISLTISFNLLACAAEHDSGSSDFANQEKTPGQEMSKEEENTQVLSFQNDILPIVQQRCSMCHNESSGLPFWEDYETIFLKRELVRLRVFELENMPLNNATGMTSEERELFALWIDQGALE